jgi:hypothetical protein
MEIHQVRSGDTLGKIARAYYGNAALYPLIVAANQIADPDRLTLGQRLTIPDRVTAERAFQPPAATTPVPPRAGVQPSSRQLSEDRLRPVHPTLAARVRTMLDLCAAQGVPVLVTQGLRTWEEQDALYAKGRTKAPIGKKYIVTNAKGGQSYHNFGLAIDIVILDSIGKADWDTGHPGWRTAADVGKSLGLEWGGDWTGFKDLPHFQYTRGLPLAECRRLYTSSGLSAIWQRVV